MRLATIESDGQDVCAAVLKDGRLLNISKAVHGLSGPGVTALTTGSMQDLIAGGGEAVAALGQLLAKAEAGEHADAIAPANTSLKAPIPRPSKNVFCVGRNYAEHIAEGDRAQKQNVGVTEWRRWKGNSCVVG